MAMNSLETELSSLYALFDVNGDGSITPTEVEQVLSSMEGIISEQEATALRQLMDSQGAVSRESFLHWAQNQPGLGTHQLLRDLFQLVDTDGSGSLSVDELSVMLSLLITSEGSVETDALLKQLDRDGNAQISLDEFLTLQKEQQPGLLPCRSQAFEKKSGADQQHSPSGGNQSCGSGL